MHRVATLVAQGAPPAEVFDAVALEMRHLLDADSARLWRYEPDSTVSLVVIRSTLPSGAGRWRWMRLGCACRLSRSFLLGSVETVH